MTGGATMTPDPADIEPIVRRPAFANMVPELLEDLARQIRGDRK